MTSEIWSIDPTVRGEPGPPLLPVDRAKLPVLVRPLVPDMNPVLGEIAGVGVAGQEPQELVDDRLHVQLLGGDERKPLGQIEAHLVAEDGQRPGAGPIRLFHAFVEGETHEVEILAHGPTVVRFRLRSTPGAELLPLFSGRRCQPAVTSAACPRRAPTRRWRRARSTVTIGCCVPS